MKSAQNFSGRVTLRLPPQKLEIYKEFKFIVTELQHSDICYVIGELIEAYVNAVKQIPNPDARTILTFAKQNIQINMGCSFNYNVKKPKRLPHQTIIDKLDLEEQVILSKNRVLPNLIEQWPTLKPRAQEFWRTALTKAGIIESNLTPAAEDLSNAGIHARLKYNTHPGSNPGCGYSHTQSCVKCHTQLRRLSNFMWSHYGGLEWK